MSVESPSFSQQLDGIVVLNKPSGPSSARCLNAFKRQGQKKIGHAGTLDPMASGVLTVLLGQATKLSRWLLNSGRKVYSGVIRLGVETDTWDMDGQIVGERDFGHVEQELIAKYIGEWLELTEQEVPAYSAAKHNGQPLYKLARKGHETPQKIKAIRIFEAVVLHISLPFVSFRVSCASGVYIRSLAHSLGERLGCGAALSELSREYSEPFSLEDAVPLAQVRDSFSASMLLPMWRALPEWPKVEVSAAEAVDIRNGRPVMSHGKTADFVFLCVCGEPLAVGRLAAGANGPCYVVERGLWNN